MCCRALRAFRIGVVAALALAAARSAHAIEAGDVAGHPLTVDVTEAATFGYRFDNRNSRPNDIMGRVDDRYAEWHNRLTVQGSWSRWILSVRLDSDQFYRTPDPNVLAAEDRATRPPPSEGEIRQPGDDKFFEDTRRLQYGRELSNRYVSTIYLSKVFLSYATPDFDATVGDVYAQLGRGLVLSMRKIDELAVDTTLRGGRLTYRPPVPGGKVSMTLLGGYANPLRVDESSGRVLQAPEQMLFVGMPTPTPTYYVPQPTSSYVPDRIVGGSIEGGAAGLVLGSHGVVLDRAPSCAVVGAERAPDYLCMDFSGNQHVRASDQVRTLSQSLSVPDLAGHGSLYVELAMQQQNSLHPAKGEYDPKAVPGYRPRGIQEDISGYALYSSVSASSGPFALTLEGKHYRKFWPLQANVKMSGVGRATEFQLLQYSAPPTTLPIWADSESGFFNVCVSGGRGRLDARVTDDLLAYGWLGRYASWSEVGSPSCVIEDQFRNDVWDAAVGIESRFEHKHSHFFAMAGARDDRVAKLEPVADETGDLQPPPASDVYYREGYVRYDLVKRLTERLSLQIVGLARHRFSPFQYGLPWWEGETYTGLQWSPRLSVTFGYEYLTREGGPRDYFNGAVLYKLTPGTTARIFVGQQRGALRCISGVCRQFPPFEGAKAEIVLRF
jgi:hypothetical protein